MDVDRDEDQPDPCEDAGKLIQHFLAGPLAGADDRRLRRHLAECAECQDLYQHAVYTAASVGRERREERVALERYHRRAELKRLAFEAPKRSRGTHLLRVLVYPAFFCFLMIQIGNLTHRAAGLRLALVQGSVRAGNQELDQPGTAAEVKQGQVCSTAADGGARIEGQDAVAELAADTHVLIERVKPLRLHLRSGSLHVSGDARVSTVLGVVELEQGEVDILLAGGQLTLISTDGSVRFTDPDGVRSMEPGEPLHTSMHSPLGH